MYDFNDGLDKDIIEPVANQYLKLPDGGRTAIHSFFVNLTYPVTAINQFLQGKFERGFEDTMRFIFNTTFGLLGFIDIAGPAGLERHQEDFGQTFAVWGIPQGNFVTLPVLGPRTVRSALGWPLDFLATPLNWIDTGGEFVALVGLDIVDPYIFTREAYLQQRLNLIYDGNPPVKDLENLDLLDESRLLEEEKTEGNIK